MSRGDAAISLGQILLQALLQKAQSVCCKPTQPCSWGTNRQGNSKETADPPTHLQAPTARPWGAVSAGHHQQATCCRCICSSRGPGGRSRATRLRGGKPTAPVLLLALLPVLLLGEGCQLHPPSQGTVGEHEREHDGPGTTTARKISAFQFSDEAGKERGTQKL